MALEIIETYWCDICLKRDKVKTEGERGAATVVDGNRMKTIDLCEVHRKELAFDDIIEFGDFIEKPLNQASALGRRRPGRPQGSRTLPRNPDVPPPAERDPLIYTSGGALRTGNRRMGQCSTCDKILSQGAIVLHNQMHKRKREKVGKWIPIEQQ
jgi:hypothetical protein